MNPRDMARLVAMAYGVSDRPPRQEEYLVTGIDALDKTLGKSLQPGSLTEIFGPAGSGKSSLLLAMARRNKNALYIDCDHSLSPQYVINMGLDPLEMPVARPADADELLLLIRMAGDLGIHLLLIDALSEMTPIDKDPLYGAMVMAKLVGLLMKEATQTGCYLVCTSQIRHSPALMASVSAGGKGVAAQAAIQLFTRYEGQIKRVKDQGFKLGIMVTKNRGRRHGESVSCEITWPRRVTS